MALNARAQARKRLFKIPIAPLPLRGVFINEQAQNFKTTRQAYCRAAFLPLGVKKTNYRRGF